MNNADALSIKREPTPSPADKTVDFDRRVRTAGEATAEVVRLMDALADELGLTVRPRHSTRTYRYGRGPAVWIEPTQARLVVDLRTLARKHPEAVVPSIHTAVSRLFYMSNVSDQPGVRLSSRVVDRWEELRAEVLEPFFRASIRG